MNRPANTVMTGAEALINDGFAELRGKRVGLITNQTGIVGRTHFADLLRAHRAISLTAIFAPEHGSVGQIEAGRLVRSSVDSTTGVPVRSLYGKTRKPTTAMLRDIDLLVFDLQDIGVRFYTFISTLALTMQAAAEANIPYLVLDRPNPLGGQYVAGFVLEAGQRSFVGQLEVPMVHGMTVGELATMTVGARLLPGLEKLQVSVRPMSGWRRAMRWPDHCGVWTATSPNINSFDAALLYPGLGLFEASPVSEGRGSETPFTVLGAAWIDSQRLADDLNDLDLPGVQFAPVRFTPRSLPGRAARPKFEGETVKGVQIIVTDYQAVQPVELGVWLLHLVRLHARRKRAGRIINKPAWLAKLAGTRRLGRLLSAGQDGAEIAAAWRPDVDRFKHARTPYLLYD